MTNLIQRVQRRRLKQRNGNTAASAKHVGVPYMPDVEGDVVGVDDADNDRDEDIDDIDDDDKDGLDEKESAFVWRGFANGKADDEACACNHVVLGARNADGDSGGDGLPIGEGDGGGEDVGDVDDVDRDNDREIDEQESDDDKDSDDRVCRGDAVRTERAEVSGDAHCAVESSLSLRSVRCDLAHAAKLRHTDRGERTTNDDDRAEPGCRPDVGDELVPLPSIDDGCCVLCQWAPTVGGDVRSLIFFLLVGARTCCVLVVAGGEGARLWPRRGACPREGHAHKSKKKKNSASVEDSPGACGDPEQQATKKKGTAAVGVEGAAATIIQDKKRVCPC